MKTTINNLPEYAKEEEAIVYRKSGGERWFFGAYTQKRAVEVAEKVGGFVIPTSAVAGKRV